MLGGKTKMEELWELDTQNRSKMIACDPVGGPKRLWVRAPAGGGKTTFLLSIARQHPSRKFLLVTFSKDLQVEVKQRARKEQIRNISPRTIDSLSYAANGGGECSALTPRNLINAFWPRLNGKWWMKKGSRDIGKVCNAALHCTGEFTPCTYHSQLHLDSYILPKLSGATPILRSHAGNRRSLYESGEPLVPADACDCILVDEVQDLDDQALILLDRCAQNIIYVGDPMQKIYGFTDTNFRCDCVFGSSKTPPPYFPPEATVNLYKTFRLNSGSVAYLTSCRDSNGNSLVQMVSGDGRFRDPTLKTIRNVSMNDTSAPIARMHHPETLVKTGQTGMVFPGVCYLFRSNKEICEFVLLGGMFPNVKIVGGDSIANVLSTFKFNKNSHNLSAFARYARTLSKHIKEKLIQNLSDRSVHGAVSTEFPIACTVHRAKGSGHKYVIVPNDIFSMLNKQEAVSEETRIAYVAATRHTTQLIVTPKVHDEDATRVKGYNEWMRWSEECTKTFLHSVETKKRKREEEVCFF
jgi:hypothetical protein